jgi:hypothetical protein
MATQDFNPDEVEAALGEARTQISDAQPGQFRQFAEAQAARATQLTANGDRLEESLGPKDPRVVAHRAMAAWSSQLAEVLGEASERQSQRPPFRANQYVLHGHILDHSGRPAEGLLVRVDDSEGRLEGFRAGATTDRFGDFAVSYPADEVERLHASGLEPHVLIEDGKGKLLYRSADPIRFKDSRAEYFEIVLAEGGRRTAGAGPTDGPRQPPKETGAARGIPQPQTTERARSSTPAAGPRIKSAAPEPGRRARKSSPSASKPVVRPPNRRGARRTGPG